MPFLKYDEFKAMTFIIGVTIGAGVIALPYVFAHAGFVVGTIELFISWAIILILTLCLGEIVLRTKENHEVSGLVGLYLGKNTKKIMGIITVVYIYGALLAYGLGLGEALHGIFGFDTFLSSIMIFLLFAAIVYFGLKTVTKAEVILTPFIFFIICVIFFFSYKHITMSNYPETNFQNLLIPLGPLFFALTGFWCVPDMKRILKNKASLKKTIILGVSIAALIYLLFAALVVGVTGINTTEVFSVGLAERVGPVVGDILYIFTFFSISTSFIGLGFALKEMFCQDYECNNTVAWCGAFLVPFVMLFFVRDGFVDVIGITGAVATACVLGITLWMFYVAKKKGKRKPEFDLNLPKAISVIIVLFCIFVAWYTVWKYIS